MNTLGKTPLGPLENAVMQILWERQSATSEEVRKALPQNPEVKASTIRTILRRLEEKKYLQHKVDGRTFVYSPRVQPENVATRQVSGIIDKLCRGSVERLLVGMVDDELISAEKLRELADRISQAESNQDAAYQRNKPRKRKS